MDSWIHRINRELFEFCLWYFWLTVFLLSRRCWLHYVCLVSIEFQHSRKRFSFCASRRSPAPSLPSFQTGWALFFFVGYFLYSPEMMSWIWWSWSGCVLLLMEKWSGWNGRDFCPLCSAWCFLVELLNSDRSYLVPFCNLNCKYHGHDFWGKKFICEWDDEWRCSPLPSSICVRCKRCLWFVDLDLVETSDCLVVMCEFLALHFHILCLYVENWQKPCVDWTAEFCALKPDANSAEFFSQYLFVFCFACFFLGCWKAVLKLEKVYMERYFEFSRRENTWLSR